MSFTHFSIMQASLHWPEKPVIVRATKLSREKHGRPWKNFIQRKPQSLYPSAPSSESHGIR